MLVSFSFLQFNMALFRLTKMEVHSRISKNLVAPENEQSGHISTIKELFVSNKSAAKGYCGQSSMMIIDIIWCQIIRIGFFECHNMNNAEAKEASHTLNKR